MATPSQGLAPDLLSSDVPTNDTESNYVSMDVVKQQEPQPESDDDEASLAGSIVSSVLTADGIHDTTGFACVCLVILIGDMSRGVVR